MSFFNNAKKAWNWVGNKSRDVSKWLGNNKGKIKNIASKIADYAPTIGGMVGGAVSSVNPAIGAGIIGAGAGIGNVAGKVRDNIDKVSSTANQTSSLIDNLGKESIGDSIQRAKKLKKTAKSIKYR